MVDFRIFFCVSTLVWVHLGGDSSPIDMYYNSVLGFVLMIAEYIFH